MKFLVRYNHHDDAKLDKTVRVTAPQTGWKKSTTSKAVLKKFVKSYNTTMKEYGHELDASSLHIAVMESGEFIPLPCDVPMTNVIQNYNNTEKDANDNPILYVRNGKANTQAEIFIQMKEIVSNQKIETVRKTCKATHCARYGCMNEYNEEQERKGIKFGPCLYHKAPPVFHQNEMFWACCPSKKVTKFTALMKIRGCETSPTCTLDDRLFLEEVNQINLDDVIPLNAMTLDDTYIEQQEKERQAGNSDELQESQMLEQRGEKLINDVINGAAVSACDDDVRDGPGRQLENSGSMSLNTPHKQASLIRFKRVLHSFGVDSVLYDDVINDMKRDFETLEMDNDKVDAIVKNKLGSMLKAGFHAVAGSQRRHKLLIDDICRDDDESFDMRKHANDKQLAIPRTVVCNNEDRSFVDPLTAPNGLYSRLFASDERAEMNKSLEKVANHDNSLHIDTTNGQMILDQGLIDNDMILSDDVITQMKNDAAVHANDLRSSAAPTRLSFCGMCFMNE